MVMQSVKLGIPAMQFELPFTMRQVFTKDGEWVMRLARLIHSFYTDFIVTH